MRIGLVAGGGRLPLILAEEIKRLGNDLVIIGLSKDIEQELRALSPQFYLINVGQIRKIIETLSKNNVDGVIIIGKIPKSVIFRPFGFDSRALKILSRLKDKSDPSIFKAIAGEFESAGLKLLDQRTYLGKLLPSKGILTKRHPSEIEATDIEYGITIAREIARLGIGQAVAVKDRTIVAVEGIEGTDEMILRSGILCSEGITIVKTAKPDQDFRFDVPTVGPNTIDALIRSKAKTLAIECGKVFVVDLETTVSKADQAKISIAVV